MVHNPPPDITEEDEKLVKSVMRQQATLSLSVGGIFILLLIGLPLFNLLFPLQANGNIFGFTATWLLLGLVFYPLTWLLSWYFVYWSDQIEADAAKKARRIVSKSHAVQKKVVAPIQPTQIKSPEPPAPQIITTPPYDEVEAPVPQPVPQPIPKTPSEWKQEPQNHHALDQETPEVDYQEYEDEDEEEEEDDELELNQNPFGETPLEDLAPEDRPRVNLTKQIIPTGRPLDPFREIVPPYSEPSIFQPTIPDPEAPTPIDKKTPKPKKDRLPKLPHPDGEDDDEEIDNDSEWIQPRAKRSRRDSLYAGEDIGDRRRRRTKEDDEADVSATMRLYMGGAEATDAAPEPPKLPVNPNKITLPPPAVPRIAYEEVSEELPSDFNYSLDARQRAKEAWEMAKKMAVTDNSSRSTSEEQE